MRTSLIKNTVYPIFFERIKVRSVARLIEHLNSINRSEVVFPSFYPCFANKGNRKFIDLTQYFYNSDLLKYSIFIEYPPIDY